MAVTLADGLKNISDGSAYKGPPASVNGLTNYGLATADDAAANITESFDSASKNLTTNLNVSKSKVTLIGLKAKSEGREPTTEELDEACGPLDFLAKAGSDLDDALGGIFSDIGEFASDFGKSIGEFAEELNQLIADVANAIDEVAKEIAEAALEVFEAVNAVAIEALEAIEGAINAAVGFVNDAIANAEELLNKAIDELIEFADSLDFASLFSLDCQEEAVDNAVDSEKVADAAEVERVVGPGERPAPTGDKTSPTLDQPQTEFAQVQTSIPPSLDALVTDYQVKARAFQASVSAAAAGDTSITRAQQDALNAAARQARNRLSIEAANQDVSSKDLPIHGPNFDQLGEVRSVSVGKDRNGDDIVTERIAPRSTSAVQTPSTAGLRSNKADSDLVTDVGRGKYPDGTVVTFSDGRKFTVRKNNNINAYELKPN